MKKKLFCILLALCMSFGNALAFDTESIWVSADENVTRFEQIGFMSPGLTISSSGYATCSCTVSLNPGYNVRTTTTLYKLVNGRWDDVHSWTHSGSGIVGVNVDDGWWVTSGTFMVEITAYVTDSSGHHIETATARSRSVTH